MATINEIEEKIVAFWKKDSTFQKSLEKTKKGKPYIFYDGPPFATGLPHYGHLLASILKDVFPRFFTMQGRYVDRVWGWDCHGLPVENIVEKQMGINSKDEIEKIGVKKFNAQCRKSVLTFAKDWEKVINRIGRWVDFERGYKTMDNEYIESVWWAFKQLYEKEYLYEGEKVLMYCPRCSTPLAKSEIAMDNSYKTVKDTTLTVKFKIKGEKDTYAIAWTTTPWTLPGNLALAVNPKLVYAFVKDKSDNNTYIMANELVGNFYKSEDDYTITKTVKGKELENIEYEPLFPYFKDNPNSFKFIVGDFVTAQDGTGIVHTSPMFGEDDNAVCRKYKIPHVAPLNEKGIFKDIVTDYKGIYIEDANEKIVIDLKTSKQAIMSRKMEHEYPFCYRCDTKLIYWALPAWFVDIQKVKKKILKLNKSINWIPEFLKDGRVHNSMNDAPDWNITRNRYWATAIPIWRSESGKIKVLGSIEELKKYAINLPKNVEIDLHKDFLDDIKLKIKDETYTRIPEVVDCWFESGSMTFAQFHYPFENKKFFDEHFPAQFVVEYIGQVRAWFYYMIVLSAILFDKIPFENVLTTGTILAADGQKMSKSKKNFTDPMNIIEKFGADAMRFYLLASPVMNADNMNFLDSGVEEIYKKVIILLSNVNNFYAMYQEKDDENYEESENLMDKWIISRTNYLIKEVEKHLKKYNTIKSCQEIRLFIDDLSTWYVRNARDRFNGGDINARKTLRFVLENTSKVIAPVMPFIAEQIYQTLHTQKDSVHLTNWPKFKDENIDEELLEQMNLTREIVSNGLRIRDQKQIGLKWPLQSAKISYKKTLEKNYHEIIKTELNVKELKVITSKDESPQVELDTNITPELEAEGFTRELSRKVQAERKNLGLNKDDTIELFIETTVSLKEKLQTQLELLKERTNSQDILFEKITDDKSIEFKIKKELGKIKIVKL